MPGVGPGQFYAAQLLSQPSRGPAQPSWCELCSVLSHSSAPLGVGLAGTQAKHLRLISGANGAWAGPGAWALLGGRRVGTGAHFQGRQSQAR